MFEAVDYEAIVQVNGKAVGKHRGGYDAFSFDVTDQIDGNKELQTLTVSVRDPTDDDVRSFLKPESMVEDILELICYICSLSKSGL